MSLSLAEALGKVQLEAGRTYRCQVRGQRVEVRVLGPAEGPTPSPFDALDVMLDPWVEFPAPTAITTVVPRLVPLPLPDVPEIPRDETE